MAISKATPSLMAAPPPWPPLPHAAVMPKIHAKINVNHAHVTMNDIVDVVVCSFMKHTDVKLIVDPQGGGLRMIFACCVNEGLSG